MESVEKSLEEIVKALHKQNEILDKMIERLEPPTIRIEEIPILNKLKVQDPDSK